MYGSYFTIRLLYNTRKHSKQMCSKTTITALFFFICLCYQFGVTDAGAAAITAGAATGGAVMAGTVGGGIAAAVVAAPVVTFVAVPVLFLAAPFVAIVAIPAAMAAAGGVAASATLFSSSAFLVGFFAVFSIQLAKKY